MSEDKEATGKAGKNGTQTKEDKKNILNENEQVVQRRAKLALLRKKGHPFPNAFRPTQLAADLRGQYQELPDSELEHRSIEVLLAGRLMTRRLMGKASFVHLQDRSGQIQLYIREDQLPEGGYEDFLQCDLGDIIGVRGRLFKTKTGELSVKASALSLLTKALRSLPDKWHGLVDQEIRYRQRYLDLIVNDGTRQVFLQRSRILQAIREFFTARDFLEVETPMMQSIPGGATARPFITHHHALDRDLYLRVSPELYLKRLVVGGLERVFELNRSFRNEGVSTRHNPEFTMIEFYQAYADYHDFMDLTEHLLKAVAEKIFGSLVFEYQGVPIHFDRPFARLSIREAILKYDLEATEETIEDREYLIKRLAQEGRTLSGAEETSWSVARLQFELFDQAIEPYLQQPTFVVGYPKEVSPLARDSDLHPGVVDRTELYIAGREIANIFSELNDPEDQAERFLQQVKEKEAGNEEAMYYDADYVTALEYGLPPTAGGGIGIDRLVMLLTNAPSIRDVLLFPQMKTVLN